MVILTMLLATSHVLHFSSFGQEVMDVHEFHLRYEMRP